MSMNKDKKLKKQKDKEFEKLLEKEIKDIFELDIPEPNPQILENLLEYMKNMPDKKKSKKSSRKNKQ